MAEKTDYAKYDYVTDVQRYAAKADPEHVGAVKRYCGIALQKKDSSLVACSDPSERKRVADNFLKKKLGMTNDDAALDKMVQEVCQQMKEDREKLRVTFYYLLAAKHGKLGVFTKAK